LSLLGVRLAVHPPRLPVPVVPRDVDLAPEDAAITAEPPEGRPVEFFDRALGSETPLIPG